MMLRTFSCTCWSFVWPYVFFGKMSVQVLCPFFKRIVLLLLLSCMSSLYILDINPLSLIRYMICKYFLPFCRLLFGFCLFVCLFLFCCAGTFKFDVVSLFCFCFCCWCFQHHTKKKKSSPRPMSKGFSPIFLYVVFLFSFDSRF